MLAEEILRAELKKLYGDSIKFFQCDIVATPPSLVKRGSPVITRKELDTLLENGWMTGSISEQKVNITAIVGPFGRIFPENPTEDRRRELCRVEAVCRVFAIKTGAVQWEPHFLKFVIKNEHGQVVANIERIYSRGNAGGETVKNTENPCQDMIDSQTQTNYPGVHRELHGRTQIVAIARE